MEVWIVLINLFRNDDFLRSFSRTLKCWTFRMYSYYSLFCFQSLLKVSFKSFFLVSFHLSGKCNFQFSLVRTIKVPSVFIQRETLSSYKCYQIHHNVKCTSTPLLEKIQFLGEKLASLSPDGSNKRLPITRTLFSFL